MSGFILLTAANVYSYLRMGPPFADGFYGFGVPFEMYETGGFVTTSRIIWSGLAANCFIALTGATLLGMLYEKALPHRGGFR